MIEPRIETLAEKKLIGKKLIMSLAGNRTPELWRSFMPKRKQIPNPVGSELYSIQVYDHSYFDNFNPGKVFEKWAAIEVPSFDIVPHEMETFILPGGLYAVFLYKGLSTDTSIFQYIYAIWLPGSNYLLDNRPHFEVLGEKYKNGNPDSEEEIWIPIKLKN
jgi:AraC family transcriptional regulator